MRIGIVFGLFEAGMPLLGLLLGHGLAGTLGDAVSVQVRGMAST